MVHNLNNYLSTVASGASSSAASVAVLKTYLSRPCKPFTLFTPFTRIGNNCCSNLSLIVLVGPCSSNNCISVDFPLISSVAVFEYYLVIVFDFTGNLFGCNLTIIS